MDDSDDIRRQLHCSVVKGGYTSSKWCFGIWGDEKSACRSRGYWDPWILSAKPNSRLFYFFITEAYGSQIPRTTACIEISLPFNLRLVLVNRVSSGFLDVHNISEISICVNFLFTRAAVCLFLEKSWNTLLNDVRDVFHVIVWLISLVHRWSKSHAQCANQRGVCCVDKDGTYMEPIAVASRVAILWTASSLLVRKIR